MKNDQNLERVIEETRNRLEVEEARLKVLMYEVREKLDRSLTGKLTAEVRTDHYNRSVFLMLEVEGLPEPIQHYVHPRNDEAPEWVPKSIQISVDHARRKLERGI